jgi:hypothetical protein
MYVLYGCIGCAMFCMYEFGPLGDKWWWRMMMSRGKGRRRDFGRGSGMGVLRNVNCFFLLPHDSGATSGCLGAAVAGGGGNRGSSLLSAPRARLSRDRQAATSPLSCIQLPPLTLALSQSSWATYSCGPGQPPTELW